MTVTIGVFPNARTIVLNADIGIQNLLTGNPEERCNLVNLTLFDSDDTGFAAATASTLRAYEAHPRIKEVVTVGCWEGQSG